MLTEAYQFEFEFKVRSRVDGVSGTTLRFWVRTPEMLRLSNKVPPRHPSHDEFGSGVVFKLTGHSWKSI